jgi:hypothetical protein
MKTTHGSPSVALLRIGLMATAFAAGSCAADVPASAPSSTSAVPSECARGAPLHTLSLQDGDGRPLTLSYLRDCGWRLVPGTALAGEASVGARPVSFDPPPARSAAPMSVFIDGPTGYIFTWTPEAHWKFVGHLVEHPR